MLYRVIVHDCAYFGAPQFARVDHAQGHASHLRSGLQYRVGPLSVPFGMNKAE